MNAQIEVGTLLLVLLGVGGVVLIIYLIVLVRNLNETLKKANTVIEEAHIVTEIAAKRAQEVDGVVDDISSSVKSISDNLKGNISIAKIAATVVNLVTSIKGLVENRTWPGKRKQR
jgi:predicted PurR-regulated permease PerM